MGKYDLGLNGYSSIFSTEKERQEDTNVEKVVSIPIESISDFKNHPFHVSLDEDMVKLIDSIQDNGILMPALVRPKKDGEGYEMIAGHRRKFAAEKIGYRKVPVIIMERENVIIQLLEQWSAEQKQAE